MRITHGDYFDIFSTKGSLGLTSAFTFLKVNAELIGSSCMLASFWYPKEAVSTSKEARIALSVDPNQELSICPFLYFRLENMLILREIYMCVPMESAIYGTIHSYYV